MGRAKEYNLRYIIAYTERQNGKVAYFVGYITKLAITFVFDLYLTFFRLTFIEK